ncbi:MAG: CapA family protein [Chloroflexi bacterium]|nr:CapA family protein [Chloroflexota bacterium]
MRTRVAAAGVVLVASLVITGVLALLAWGSADGGGAGSVLRAAMQRYGPPSVFTARDGRQEPQEPPPHRPPAAPAAPPPLTLEAIFPRPADLSGLDPARLRTIVVTGDVIPARVANHRMVRQNAFADALGNTAPLLREADLTFINLEAPLPKHCPVMLTGMQFCGDQRFIQALNAAQIDVASLANNHIDNFGPQGFQETVELLTRHGIRAAYDDVIAQHEVRGLRFAFLAFNGVGPRLDRDRIARTIQEARRTADVVLVMYHWGREYTLLPETQPGIAEDHPRAIGRFTLDAGADLVLGNHPHWVQGIEFHRDRLITYSHGNFLFDQTWSQETQEGVIGTYTFSDTQLVAVQYHPVLIEDAYRPRLLSQEEGAHILERMWQSSRMLRDQPWQEEPAPHWSGNAAPQRP